MIFVGSLGYRPNVEGLLWFAERVMPQIGPSRLLVAGADPPRELLEKRLGGRIRYLGYVDCLADAYAQAMLAIAPMHAGGGTRDQGPGSCRACGSGGEHLRGRQRHRRYFSRTGRHRGDTPSLRSPLQGTRL